MPGPIFNPNPTLAIRHGFSACLFLEKWHNLTARNKELQFLLHGTYDMARLAYLRHLLVLKRKRIRPTERDSFWMWDLSLQDLRTTSNVKAKVHKELLELRKGY